LELEKTDIWIKSVRNMASEMGGYGRR